MTTDYKATEGKETKGVGCNTFISLFFGPPLLLMLYYTIFVQPDRAREYEERSNLIDKVCIVADSDNNGLVSLEEWAKVYTKVGKKDIFRKYVASSPNYIGKSPIDSLTDNNLKDYLRLEEVNK